MRNGQKSARKPSLDFPKLSIRKAASAQTLFRMIKGKESQNNLMRNLDYCSFQKQSFFSWSISFN